MDHHITDELLEAVWRGREDGDPRVEAVLGACHAAAGREELAELALEGLVLLDGQSVELSPEGERRAAGILRRHRLAERLIVDVLGRTVEQSELPACAYEHAVVPEVTDCICTLLGHPRECPHGKPIPPGECCEQGLRGVSQALLPLSGVEVGRQGRVAYLRPHHHDRLHVLLSMGIAPGVRLRVHQRTPMLVIAVDAAEFAMDLDVAGDIWVWLEPIGG